MKDVYNPDYYRTGKIEVADFIEDKGFNFFLGNVVKYVSRAGKKEGNDAEQDLRKAKWYLDREIGRLESKNRPRPERLGSELPRNKRCCKDKSKVKNAELTADEYADIAATLSLLCSDGDEYELTDSWEFPYDESDFGWVECADYDEVVTINPPINRKCRKGGKKIGD
ncbi:MAG: DUF3310 domain-containing protein [Bacteroidales bacterium]|nr:DUF3310 domain-containing protein [Bacteroidales bacterium]